MRKYLPLFVLVLISNYLFAQQPTIFDPDIQKITTNDDLVSAKTLNKFFAKRLAYYLTGSKDLSLFKNYATYDVSDDRLFLGANFNMRGKKDELYKHILTTGVNTDIADGFAAIFSEKKFQNNLSVTIKYTYSFNGIISFDKDPKKAKDIMKDKREVIKNALQFQYDKEMAEVKGMIAGISNPTLQGKTKNELEAEIKKKYLKQFTEKELEALEEKDENSKRVVYNSANKTWLSISADLPLTSTSYDAGTNLSGVITSEKNKPFKFIGSANFLYEKKGNKWFYSLTGSLLNNNTASAELMDKYSREQFRTISTSPDTVRFANFKEGDIYIGQFENFWTPALSGQVVFYPSFSQHVGLDFRLKKNFGKYFPLDLTLGIPVTVPGKDEDSFINFEILFKRTDLTNNYDKEASSAEKWSFGLSIGLPFNSILK